MPLSVARIDMGLLSWRVWRLEKATKEFGAMSEGGSELKRGRLWVRVCPFGSMRLGRLVNLVSSHRSLAARGIFMKHAAFSSHVEKARNQDELQYKMEK